MTIFFFSLSAAIKAAYQGKCCFAAEAHTYTALYKMSSSCHAVLRHLGIMVEGNTHACTRHQRDGAILGNPLGKTAETKNTTFLRYNITPQQAKDIISSPPDPDVAQLERVMNEVSVASPIAETKEEEEEEPSSTKDMDLAGCWARQAYLFALELARERNYSCEGLSPFVPFIPRPVQVEVAPISRGRDTWPGIHEDHSFTVVERLAELNALERSEGLDDGSDDEGRRKRPCSPAHSFSGRDEESDLALSDDDDDDQATDCSTDDGETEEDATAFREHAQVDASDLFSATRSTRDLLADFKPSEEFIAPRPIGVELGRTWSFGAVRLPLFREWMKA